MYYGGSVVSSVDFHGRMSFMIFLSQCPLRCPYCQNPELLNDKTEKPLDEVLELINHNADFMDAVIVSGGEPLVQSDDVLSILKYSKDIGLETKLDTSAVYPDRLEPLLDYTDYVAMDIKVPFDKYKEIIGAPVGDAVKESMEMVYNRDDVVLECRTTYVPKLISLADIETIAKTVKCDIYTLQQFRNRNVLDQRLYTIDSPNAVDMREFAQYLKKYYFKDVEVFLKTAEFGNELIK
ncbi:anaerobic ribonucleoside-triphosphate reductase activating protein [Methanobrevibacter sp. 87.7]|uniref:anaerobic ribonucleoside-triphosphate reductase activating protein n=1 Tax=Methanobrevibacter sp. 87.7 TaxID=387957 RepID=UPI000B505F30|nr:anaerobic ribonucleoside-triphosphate reductase activating protein [Methanobrevibacter sp. 87.7]OWT33271.1 anaerobic ribonucleoside-triphosphate reductase activating protein [Methanobrevibacter sp. 87.7]